MKKDIYSKYRPYRIIIILFDVAQQSHTTQGPVLGTFVALKVNGSDVVVDCPARFPVYRALVLLDVPACRAVDGVDEDDRHRLKQDFRLRLDQFPSALIKTCSFQKQAVDVDSLPESNNKSTEEFWLETNGGGSTISSLAKRVMRF